VLTYASHAQRTSANWVTVTSVPDKNYGQGTWGGTEIAIHWREGFQDGRLRTTEYISVPLLKSGRSMNTSFMDIFPKLVCVLCIPYSPHAIQTVLLTETTRESERFKALSLFNTIYGIGPATARTLYDRGLRSLRDLEAYYEVDTGSTPAENSESTDMDIRIALGLRSDLVRTCESLARTRAKTFVLTQYSIPRIEVEAIHATIMGHLNAVQPGCVSTITGGYVFIPRHTVEPPFFSQLKPRSPGTVGGSRKAMISTLSSRIRMQSRPKISVDVSSSVCDLRAW
jgi:hypothetical protein